MCLFVESDDILDFFFFSFFPQLLECVRKDGWKYLSDTEWWSTLRDKIAANAKISKVRLDSLFKTLRYITVLNYATLSHCATCNDGMVDGISVSAFHPFKILYFLR